MAKRGCGFNNNLDWEWFSLQNNSDGTVLILWRGTLPPPGQTYSGKPIGDCNGCHTMAVDNDFVWDTALQLSKF
jgi:hypothetical protein